MVSNTNILEVNNLNISYQNSDFSISNLSFNIPKGYIVGLIGENGAGKTTVINSILGLKKIDFGTIEFWGKPFDIDDIELKNKISICFDEIYLPKNLKLTQVGKIYALMYKNWNKDFFNKTLKKFNISMEKRIGECSKGMQKMFSIVLAMATDPDFLILDEPTSALDPVKRREILDVFQEFVMEENKSILFSSHITSDIEQIADIVIYMREGRIEFIEPITKLLCEYVLLRCSEQDFQLLNSQNIVAYRKRSSSYEVLLSSGENISLSDCIFDKPRLEDIMNIYSKGVII